ncbi:MAG: metallophosphoesterase [Lachnospiraceae bacterium]|nr:metallophosphoesterase [Lachnospiraceae bacterium]
MELTINNKNVYVMSDIHNDAKSFKAMLKLINFTKDDLLIIDGDVFDRGNNPVDLYFEILRHENIICLRGNHDEWVRREILYKYCDERVGEYLSYGTFELLNERLTPVDIVNIAVWIGKMPYFLQLNLNGKNYQIAHAQTFPTIERIINKRMIIMGDAAYYEFLDGKMNDKVDYISVVGHTSTDSKKIMISSDKKLIRIDCGNGYRCYNNDGFPGPECRLGCIRLNDWEEYYV